MGRRLLVFAICLFLVTAVAPEDVSCGEAAATKRQAGVEGGETVAKGTWLTDYEAAMGYAKQYHRPVLLNFTGSDWCTWCNEFKKEVFDQKLFLEFAKKNLVLLEVDFPSRKSQPANVVSQNQALDKRFNIRRYPTMILIDEKGNEMAKNYYQRGGAEEYVRYLSKLVGKDEENFP
jgi:protein disulfide-isomerase